MDLPFNEKMKQLRDVFYPYRKHTGKDDIWVENTPKEAKDAFEEFQNLYKTEKIHNKY